MTPYMLQLSIDLDLPHVLQAALHLIIYNLRQSTPYKLYTSDTAETCKLRIRPGVIASVAYAINVMQHNCIILPQRSFPPTWPTPIRLRATA